MTPSPNASLTIVHKQDKIEALVEWFSLPPELRPEPTLRQLAIRLGVPPDGGFYQLAKSSRVLRDVVAATAIGILPRIPEVLGTLAENGIRGNTKAADVLLNHLRQVLDLLPKEQEQSRTLIETMNDTGRAIDLLLKVAESHPNPPAGWGEAAAVQDSPLPGLPLAAVEAGDDRAVGHNEEK